MDGTLYKGEDPIPGAKEFVTELRRRGIPFRFLTNNSSHACGFFADRLNRMGFGIDAGDVLSSTVATARFILSQRAGRKVRILATPEVTEELRVLGVEGCDSDPDIVLLTFDTTIDYDKLNTAYHDLLAGAELIATHPDDLCPTETSFDVDIGPFIRLFEELAGKKATVIGKPSGEMLRMAAMEMDVAPEDVVMIGDRLSTDIAMGEKNGTRTILVLSGETDEAMLRDSRIRPTFVAGSVASVIPEIVDRGLLRFTRTFHLRCGRSSSRCGGAGRSPRP